MDIGINDKDRAAVAEGLSRVLSDTATVYYMTHAFHWNVQGPMFQTLHLMFETQYNEMWLALDLLAERIRALGHFAPGSWGQIDSLASVKEADGVPDALDMVRQLVEGHEALIRTARGVLPLAEAAGDEVTADVLTQRLTAHEKTAWMLRSLLA